MSSKSIKFGKHHGHFVFSCIDGIGPIETKEIEIDIKSKKKNRSKLELIKNVLQKYRVDH